MRRRFTPRPLLAMAGREESQMRTGELRWGWGAALVALGLGFLAPCPARAAEGKAAPAASSKKAPSPAARGTKVPITVNVAALTERLKSSDPADVEKALGEAKAAGKG